MDDITARKAARRALAAGRQLAEARDLLAHFEREVVRLRNASPVAQEQAARKMARARGQVVRFTAERGEAMAATNEEALREERARLVARARRKAGPVPAAGSVKVRTFEPVGGQTLPACQGCGKPAQVRQDRKCSKCLRKAGLQPCPSCGVWMKAGARRRHACGRGSSTSVRTVSGGLPGLGGRG